MKIWFTIAGTCHHHGHDFLEKGMKVRLEKEPDNKHDKEAVKVMLEGLGLIGYVANSVHTVVGDSWRAGRLYDRIGDTAESEVVYVTDDAVLGTVEGMDLIPAPGKEKADGEPD